MVGIIATVLSLLVGDWLLFDNSLLRSTYPVSIFDDPRKLRQVFHYLLFLFDGLFISILCGVLQRYANKTETTQTSFARSQAIFRQIFNSSLIGFLMTKQNGQIVDANDAFLQMLGYTRTDLDAKRLNWFDLTPPEYREVSRQKTRALARGEHITPFEKEYLHRDGRRISALIGAGRIDTPESLIFITYVLDITETKAEERRRRFLETRFHTVFDQSPIAMMLFNTKGDVVNTNRSWEDLFATSRKPLKGYNVFDDPQVKSLSLEPELQRALAGEAVRLRPLRYDPHPVGQPGRARWLQLSIFPVKDERNQVREVALFEVDMTDQIHALHALQESESHFRELVDATPAMVWLTNVKGEGEYFNKALLDFTGHKSEELLGQGWVHNVHPADLPKVKETMSKSLKLRQPFEMEYRLRKRDGGFHWVLDRGNPRLASDGTFLGLIGASVDISEHKRAEEVLIQAERRARLNAEVGEKMSTSLNLESTARTFTELIVPNIADWCVLRLFDNKGVLHSLAIKDSRDSGHIGFVAEHEKTDILLTTSNGPYLVTRTGQSQFIRDTDEFARTQNPENETTNKALVDAFHRLRIKSYICVPIKARGQIIGAISFGTRQGGGRIFTAADRDLIEELSSRAALAIDNARLYQEAQNVSRMQDEFLAMLSHELRTPLNVIQGHADLLRNEAPDLGELNASIEAIYRNVRTQTHIISDLLDASSIITGKVAFRPESLSPTEAARTAIDSVRSTAKSKGIRFTLDVSKAPQRIYSDPTRLQQILWNLLSNAIKFSKIDSEIDVRIAEEGDRCRIDVRDQGIGIEADFIPFVFDRFRQEDSSLTRPYGGLGLGLSIVRHLAELHGGDVKAFSGGKDQGATFTVYLPITATQRWTQPETLLREKDRQSLHERAAGDESDHEPSAHPPMDQKTSRKRLLGVHVLLVEDDADSRALIKRILERAGAAVTAAPSAAEGMIEIETHRHDIIVSDIAMPDEDGYSFMNRVRRLSPSAGGELPAVALTAYARDDERRRALNCGFQVHLAKPVEAAGLIESIDHLVHSIEPQ